MTLLNKELQMSPLRKTAFAAGALYLLSFVSIPTLFLYIPVRASNYVLGSGSDTGVIVGAILEMIVALAGIGTAVALFPVVKRQNEGVALGAPRSSAARIHRRDPSGRWRRRCAVRSHRSACLYDRADRNPDRSLGVFARRLFGRQRL